MNRQYPIHHLLAAFAVAACLATPLTAGAGMLDKWFKKGDGERPDCARFDRHPSLVFDGGTLTTDISGHWRLGGSVLVFTGSSQILAGDHESSSRSLRMGQEARVTGYRLADGSVAVRRLRVFTGRQRLSGLGTLERGTGTAPAGSPR